MNKLFNEALASLEKITKGKKIINLEQLDLIGEIAYTHTENCGASGTGKGTIYTVYLTDIEGNEIKEELAELILVN